MQLVSRTEEIKSINNSSEDPQRHRDQPRFPRTEMKIQSQILGKELSC